MADIFFGKFSELISPKDNLEAEKIPSNVKSNQSNNKINKKLIYTSSVATLALKKNQQSDETFEPNLNDISGDYKKSKFLAEYIVKNLVKKKN